MPKAINISALEAKDIPSLKDGWVLISINSPDEPLHELQISRLDPRVLTVKFWDICAKREYNGNIICPMDGDEATKIVRFIREWKDMNFLIHCQAGVSRSGAVAMFIHQLHGHELRPDFWQVSRPNPYVLGKLFLLHEQVK